jgi:secreted PhoX family phosphatase
MDDSTPGQVYIYAGTKSSSPDRVAAAGLSGGSLFGVKVAGVTAETDATTITSAPFTVVALGNVTNTTGSTLDRTSRSQGVTDFNRPEDAAWDPNDPRDLYFVTTASFTGRSRLWRLRFADPAQPELGGTATVLIDGANANGPKMMDNMTINKRGTVLIQEDPGSQDYLAKLWRYNIGTGALEIIAQHDPARFTPGAPGFLTRDEESSGIIPMDDILGEGWYLLDVQAHYQLGGELVEGGQLLGLHFSPGQEKK